MTDTDNTRRSYNSPVRRQQRENTRQKIINAGAELIQKLPTWDLQSLTFKAISETAGVSERTVYRYFATEKQLKDTIVQHMVADAGIDLSALNLVDFADVTSHMFRQISSYAASSRQEVDPTFATVDEERRTALLRAATNATSDWSPVQQLQLAAMLDMLWDVPPFQRMMNVWGLNAEQAISALSWVIDLINQAVSDGNRPQTGTPPD